MTRDQLKRRTKDFALRTMKLVDALPSTISGEVLGKQLLRSATSVGANYRSACRGRSEAEITSKLGIVIEEADESGYWLELITEGALMKPSQTSALLKESDELVAIFTASVRTTRSKSKPKTPVPTESGAERSETDCWRQPEGKRSASIRNPKSKIP